MRHGTLLVGLVLASLFSALPARGETSAEDRAAADALYEEAGKLMKAKRWAEACPKLEASAKLDAGIGTSLRLGYCYEQIGRTASAWSAYNDAEAMARKAGDKRADEAARHAKHIEPLLSRLVLDVALENRSGVEVRRAGRVIDPAVWTSAIPIDPGTHVVEALGSGRQPWKTTITIEAKPGVTMVRVPALATAAEPGVMGTTGGTRPFWGTQRIAGAAVGGVGVVGLVLGSVFGASALSKMSTSKESCRPAQPADICDASGLAARQDAKIAGTASTAAFVIGGAAIAASVVVFFTPTATKAPRLTIAGTPSGGTLAVEGRW